MRLGLFDVAVNYLNAEVIRTCGFQEYPAILNEPSLMLVSLGGGR